MRSAAAAARGPWTTKFFMGSILEKHQRIGLARLRTEDPSKQYHHRHLLPLLQEDLQHHEQRRQQQKDRPARADGQASDRLEGGTVRNTRNQQLVQFRVSKQGRPGRDRSHHGLGLLSLNPRQPHIGLASISVPSATKQPPPPITSSSL